ncbi:Ras-related protein Rab [Acrasis kona]|uniref:Ras-related protein Rab n=1 Tax=Acrasis kona TaxID=1008807 RepID=A0AAW2Z1N8_9EUKA
MKKILHRVIGSSSSSSDDIDCGFQDIPPVDFTTPTTQETVDFKNSVAKYKIIIVGDSGVGKTSLIESFKNKNFQLHTSPTMGVDFSVRDLKLDNGDTVNLRIFDSAGQSIFREILKPDVQGVVVVYDITDSSSFDSCAKWIETAREHSPENVKISLTGNKSDLDSSREVTYYQGRDFAEQRDVNFTEVSAKTIANVDKLFVELVKRIHIK